jgi:hypothetical protein
MSYRLCLCCWGVFWSGLISSRCDAAQPVASVAAKVDRLIEAAAGQPVAPRSDDWEFCRRIHLDLAGRIPTVRELQAFVDDPATEKRTALIDRLLLSPEYSSRLRDVLHVQLMERLGDDPEWISFLEHATSRNLPWDQLTRTILNPPEDDQDRRGAAYFLSRRLENYGQNPVDLPALTRDVGRLFLGVDLQCAQCHDHLFVDDYKQLDFQGLHSFLAHTFVRQDVKFPAVGEKLVTQKTEFSSVFLKQPQTTGPRLPFGEEVGLVTFDKGDEFAIPPDKKTRHPGRPRFSPLAVLAERLPTAENSYFVCNAVNRFWAQLMGRGLVHPLDLHHSGNPPSHPDVLDLLAREFVAHQLDIRWLLRELALTETYQRTSAWPEERRPFPPIDRYVVALERPLVAEQVAHSLWLATGQTEKLTGEMQKKFLSAFANPPREPEGEFAPSVKAVLFLSHDIELLRWLEPCDGNLSATLLAEQDAPRTIDRAFRAVLSRPPANDELVAAQQMLNEFDDGARGIRQLIWALSNTTEFAVNH